MPYKDRATQREYARKWVAARRAEWFADKACVQCGSTDRMELDHIDRFTKVNHAVWSWTKARREAELAKCQVLCSTHHLEKTLRERTKTEHGHAGMYQTHGCHCQLCRAWKAASDKKYRGPAS